MDEARACTDGLLTVLNDCEQVSRLKASLDETRGRVQSMRAEKEEAAFQLANLQEVRPATPLSHPPCPPPKPRFVTYVEAHSFPHPLSTLSKITQDHDTLTELLNFTTGKSKELEAALAEAQASIQSLQADGEHKDAALQHLRSQVRQATICLDTRIS